MIFGIKVKNIFCDSGTYSYASDLGKELVKTAAHNTVKLQEIEQMESYGNFLYINGRVIEI